MKGKRGQAKSLTTVFGIIMGISLLVLAVMTLMNIGQGFGSSFGTALDDFGDFFVEDLGPFFNLILGTDKAGDNGFLVILAFILMSIIIVGTLDSTNIFGDDNQGGLINLGIGIIVSIIGVRFMPPDLWVSLTAPSSALIATFLVGGPFIVLFYLTMKIKFPLLNKLIWLFYIIFMSYLVFFPGSLGRDEISPGGLNDFIWIYIVFLFLAAIMMIFDSTVRKVVFTELRKAHLEKGISMEAIKRRAEIQGEIKELIILRKDMGKEDKKNTNQKIKELKGEYAKLG